MASHSYPARPPLPAVVSAPAPAFLSRVQQQADRLRQRAADGPTVGDADRLDEEANLLESQALMLVDAVERLAPGVDPADAVLIDGSHGPVLVSSAEYADHRVFHETTAGEVTAVIRGADLLG